MSTRHSTFQRGSINLRKIGPVQHVPAVEVDGETVADSMALIMYFEDKFPDKKPLLPNDLVARATVRQVVYLITANIQPLQNLGTLRWSSFWGKELASIQRCIHKKPTLMNALFVSPYI